jgi:hypothetical protein
MKTLCALMALLLEFSVYGAEPQKLLLALDDEYTVQDTEQWTVSVQRYVTLRFADVKVLPKQHKSFSLMLYFQCDTKDQSRVDTPEKMMKSVLMSSKKYLRTTVEKEIKVEEMQVPGRYGFKTKLTDASMVNKKPIPEGEFLYIIRGMIRLSDNAALGFSLMTNDPNSQETRDLEKYICSFAKANKT